ncbi:hypothetical protein NDU88_002651 [Pleurodeles waltl]|uniref:Uncharacterized protein n=1 Tax=Pleurodeles waltl TaxID=8319 RepID=A0AAV7QAH1_PLEWA|nr:hypothetical protein NDU88_002651 [Pleurodeles waltl]
MTPDFRLPGVVKGENRLRADVEEEDEDAEEPEETADGGLEQPSRRSGNLDVPREATDPVQEGRREETRRNRHAPGWVWLSKVQSFFKGQRIETQKSWDRGEEDGAEGAEREAAGRGQGSHWRNREKDTRDNNSIEF